ncbi:MAG: type I-E CRISPR-associated protein Cas6/Cse3/CasE [Candidatus Glassbacteria bacterium]
MFLSRLTIDVGDNPDRPRPGRLWLRNLYRVHQRLCMGFPSDSRKSTDRDFLSPYCPEDFPEQRHLADRSAKEVEQEILKDVHARRDVDRGFLFRIDPQPGGRVVILVQSAKKPDWDYAFHNASHLLAAPWECKEIDPCFTEGQRLRFRFVANPTKKIGTIKKKERLGYTKDELRAVKGRHGKRIPVPSVDEIEKWHRDNPNEDVRTFICSKLLDWLAHQAEISGFSLERDFITVQPGYSYFKKPGNGSTEEREDKRKYDEARPRSVRYEGILRVTDPERLKEILIRGIGPGKAFGFGLISVAPSRPSS